MIRPADSFEETRYDREELKMRARRAQQIINDPVFVDAVKDAELECVRDWLEARTPQLREEIWGRAHALRAVQRSLERIVSHGEHLTLSSGQ